MATSNTKSTPENTTRWSRSGESGNAFNGPSRSARGRSGRARTGPRNGKASHHGCEDQAPKSVDSASADKPPRPLLPAKPVLSVTPPSNPPSATKPKNSSRRPSRTNSAINTTQSSPVVETPVSTTSSRSSNRRRRSGAGKGNNIPKINPPAPQDNLLRPGRPRVGSVPHTAPIKDTPPHLTAKPPRTPNGTFDMSKDIDALVERVRAVAMAENRPSTPGSHIDWAGDDDNSLPDLDDWGITSLSAPDPRTQIISPIIVGGLKPLPELNPSSNDGPTKSQEDSDEVSPQSSGDSEPVPDSQVTADENIERTRPSELDEVEMTLAPVDGSQIPDASGDLDSPGSGGLAQSIHAPTAGLRPGQEKEGLGASIHAPRAVVDSSSSSAQIGPPYSRPIHTRAQTVGRPFPRQNRNDVLNSRLPRNGRGGLHGSPRQHMRNHSSPAATTTRHPHSRPILTGDAISRLAKVVGSTTTASAKPTPIAND